MIEPLPYTAIADQLLQVERHLLAHPPSSDATRNERARNALVAAAAVMRRLAELSEPQDDEVIPA